MPKAREDATWAEHLGDSFCADVEPVRAKASPHRAPLCIRGHRRDAFGICWVCATSKAAGVLRARPRRQRASALARSRSLWVGLDRYRGFKGVACATLAVYQEAIRTRT